MQRTSGCGIGSPTRFGLLLAWLLKAKITVVIHCKLSLFCSFCLTKLFAMCNHTHLLFQWIGQVHGDSLYQFIQLITSTATMLRTSSFMGWVGAISMWCSVLYQALVLVALVLSHVYIFLIALVLSDERVKQASIYKWCSMEIRDPQNPRYTCIYIYWRAKWASFR